MQVGLDGHHGGRFVVPEQFGPARSVERGRHDDDSQLGAQFAQLAEHGEAQVGVEVSFVNLVEDDGADVGQFRVVEQASDEDARRDELDRRVAAGARFSADGEPHRPAESLTGEMGQPAGTGTGGDPSGLGDDDPAVQPGRCEQVRHQRRDEGGLAGTRRSLDDGDAAPVRAGQGGLEVADGSGDGQSGADAGEVEGHGDSLPRLTDHPAPLPHLALDADRMLDMYVTEDESTDEILQGHRDAIAASDVTVAELGLDAVGRVLIQHLGASAHVVVYTNTKPALHNLGCRSGLNPPASSSDLAM